MSTLITLAIAMALKLAADPATYAAVQRLYELVLDLVIPDPDKQFLAATLRVIKGIRHDDPQFSVAEQNATAIAAIRQLAADQGRVLDTAILTTLGLQTL